MCGPGVSMTIGTLRRSMRGRLAAVSLLAYLLAGCGVTPPSVSGANSGAIQGLISDHLACPAVRFDFPQWSPDGSRIYFTEVPAAGGLDDLRVMTSLGRDDHLLIQDALAPLVSPDGSMVLFQRASPGTIQSYHFFVYDLATGQHRPLSTAGVRASWSPDSRWFAYATPSGPVSGINRIDVRTNQIDTLSHGPYWSDWPLVSPDGRTIAFTQAQDAGPTDILTMGDDGGGLAPLSGLDTLVCPNTPSQANAGVDDGLQLTAWRPDGRALAAQRICQDSTLIRVISPAGAELSRLDVPGRDVSDLTWSPDGTRLAFTAHDRAAGTDSLVVARADGTSQRVVQADAAQPRWSPDGSQIVFVGQDSSGLDEIETIHPDGSNLNQLSNNPGNGMCLH